VRQSNRTYFRSTSGTFLLTRTIQKDQLRGGHEMAFNSIDAMTFLKFAKLAKGVQVKDLNAAPLPQNRLLPC
jgi:hypothetical protein